MDDAPQRMDRMYRYQRHVYDLTRRYYLLGRDELLNRMDLREGARVLEIGCGTARNLIALSRRRPDLALFGLDASREMLDTAQAKIARRGLTGRITLRQGLAQRFDYTDFGLDRPFDAVFFSYALSMIPQGPEAVDAALVNVKPGGVVHVVDFGDGAGLPTLVRRSLVRWLAMFDVYHRPELLAYLRNLWQRDHKVAIDPIYQGYAYLARITRVAGSRDEDCCRGSKNHAAHPQQLLALGT